MEIKEKLVELVLNADNDKNLGWYDLYDLTHEKTGCAKYFADYLIAHGVTVQEWISVKDRLPKGGEIVTICTEKGFVYAGELIGDAWFLDNDSWTENVTHWMPLPKPPKGE